MSNKFSDNKRIDIYFKLVELLRRGEILLDNVNFTLHHNGILVDGEYTISTDSNIITCTWGQDNSDANVKLSNIKEGDILVANYRATSKNGLLINPLRKTFVVNNDLILRKELVINVEVNNPIVNQLEIDKHLANITFSEKRKSEQFFNNVIDQAAHFSDDYQYRFRKMLVDWYSAHKSLVTQHKISTDPFSLTSEQLNEMIKSFGFPLPNYIIGRQNKALFLSDLINFYKNKGTPETLVRALQYFGLGDVVLSEWWIHKRGNDFIARSKPAYPNIAKGRPENILEMPYDVFIEGDPFWHIDENTLNNYYENSQISLPSLTPIISLHTSLDIMSINSGLSILNRKLQEIYSYWLEYVLDPILNTNGQLVSVKSTILDPPDSPVVGDAYLVGNTYQEPDEFGNIITRSPTGAFSGRSGYIQVWTQFADGNFGWRSHFPQRDNIFYAEWTDSNWVYNGVRWVDIETTLPSESLNKSKTGVFNRDVTLNNFQSQYSLLEVILMLSYLYYTTEEMILTNDEWSKTTPDINTQRYMYNGQYSPFDSNGDDITDNQYVYDYVIDEYNDLTRRSYGLKRPTSKEEKEEIYHQYMEIFTEENVVEPNITTRFFHMMRKPSVFLDALNPYFREDADNLIRMESRDRILETFLFDFEYYLKNTISIIDLPISHTLIGSSVYDRIKQVIDFFKPFRARIRSFLTSFDIKDRIGDSMLASSYMRNIKISSQFVDKGPWNLFDQGLVIDKCVLSLFQDFDSGRGGDDDVDKYLHDVLYRIGVHSSLNEDYRAVLGDRFVAPNTHIQFVESQGGFDYSICRDFVYIYNPKPQFHEYFKNDIDDLLRQTINNIYSDEFLFNDSIKVGTSWLYFADNFGKEHGYLDSNELLDGGSIRVNDSSTGTLIEQLQF